MALLWLQVLENSVKRVICMRHILLAYTVRKCLDLFVESSAGSPATKRFRRAGLPAAQPIAAAKVSAVLSEVLAGVAAGFGLHCLELQGFMIEVERRCFSRIVMAGG